MRIRFLARPAGVARLAAEGAHIMLRKRLVRPRARDLAGLGVMRGFNGDCDALYEELLACDPHDNAMRKPGRLVDGDHR
jgi:hypothetical protein